MSGSIILDDNDFSSRGLGASEWKLMNMKLNTKRKYFASASSNHFIYVIGGIVGRNVSSSVERFDTLSNHRCILPSLNFKRFGCAAVIVGKKLYVIGGFNGKEWFDSLEMLDLTEEHGWVTLPSPMKEKRWGFGAVAYNHCIYVVGGREGAKHFSSMEMFDTKTSKWTELSPMGTARWYPSAVVADGCIFVMGGHDNQNSTLPSMESYNMKTNEWTSSLPSMITQRYGGGSVSLSNDFFIVMGGLPFTSNVEAYHIHHKKWISLPQMTKKRNFLSCAMIDGSVYALGGGDEKGEILCSIEKMDINGLKMNPPPPPSFPDPPNEFQSKKRIEALQVYVSKLESLTEEYSEKYNKKKNECHGIVQEKIDYHRSIIRKHEEQWNDVEGEFEKVFSSWMNDVTDKLQEAKSQIDLLESGEDKKKRSSVPNQLLCPLTLEIMRDPVMASDGFTYEREAIESVLNLSDKPKSPMTNEPFVNRNLMQNNAIRSLCREYSSK